MRTGECDQNCEPECAGALWETECTPGVVMLVGSDACWEMVFHILLDLTIILKYNIIASFITLH